MKKENLQHFIKGRPSLIANEEQLGIFSDQQRELIAKMHQGALMCSIKLRQIDTIRNLEFQDVLKQQEFNCKSCKKILIGNQCGAHYKNNPDCKKKKDQIQAKQMGMQSPIKKTKKIKK